jgi:hypothetical protein
MGELACVSYHASKAIQISCQSCCQLTLNTLFYAVCVCVHISMSPDKDREHFSPKDTIHSLSTTLYSSMPLFLLILPKYTHTESALCTFPSDTCCINMHLASVDCKQTNALGPCSQNLHQGTKLEDIIAGSRVIIDNALTFPLFPMSVYNYMCPNDRTVWCALGL